MLSDLTDLTGKNPAEAIKIIEDYLRVNKENLEYILSHLDSSNIVEIDTNKTTIYKGEENEL